jgi:uncharacterized protein (TIGR03083 family)
MRQLVTHVGRAQRWAAEIARTRSAKFIEFRSVPDGRPPDDHADRGRWLADGAARLVTVLRDAGEDEVWAFGQMAPASFWARRMAHETTVHCADARLAVGGAVRMPADLAADAIDEWLTVLSGPVYGRPDPRAAALAPGATLHVHATDAEPGCGEWLVRHSPDGVRVEAGNGGADPGGRPPGTPRGADVALSGPAADVLLVLLRRRPATDQAVRVAGDRAVLDTWLSQTSF